MRGVYHRAGPPGPASGWPDGRLRPAPVAYCALRPSCCRFQYTERGHPFLDTIVISSRGAISDILALQAKSEPLQRRGIASEVCGDGRSGSLPVIQCFGDTLGRQWIESQGCIANSKPTYAHRRSTRWDRADLATNRCDSPAFSKPVCQLIGTIEVVEPPSA